MRFTGDPFPSPTTRLRPDDHCAQRGSVSTWALVVNVSVLGRVEIVRYRGAVRFDKHPFWISAKDFMATYELPERLQR